MGSIRDEVIVTTQTSWQLQPAMSHVQDETKEMKMDTGEGVQNEREINLRVHHDQ